jgi:Tol biopolymer transport system component
MRSRTWLGLTPMLGLLGVVASLAAGCGLQDMPASSCRDYEGTMAVSPDGRTLAVAAIDSGTLRIFLVDLRSGATHRLTHASCDLYPAFSPDGRSLVLLHQDYELTRINRDGNGRRKVHGSDIATDNLQWTKSGILVYGSESINGFGGDLVNYIATTPATGGHETHPIHHARYPTASPDGKHLAYVSDSSDHMDIATYPAGTPRRVLNYKSMSNLAWSPDGHWIAFHTPKGISLVTPSGQHLQLLVDNSAADNPTWLPDSRHLLYSQHGSHHIYETSATHDDTRPIINLTELPTRAA